MRCEAPQEVGVRYTEPRARPLSRQAHQPPARRTRGKYGPQLVAVAEGYEDLAVAPTSHGLASRRSEEAIDRTAAAEEVDELVDVVLQELILHERRRGSLRDFLDDGAGRE